MRLFDRDPYDWHVEPTEATAGLLRVERFVGPIWDPACGGGNVLRACTAGGCSVMQSDIVRRVLDNLSHLFAGQHDFLTARIDPPNLPFPAWHTTNIITNPPFFKARGTEAFIRKALTIAKGKVAVFTDLKFLASQRRATGLFAELCPHRVRTLAKRPSCPSGEYLAAGNEAGGGTADWCWIVWDLTAPATRTYQGGWILPEGAVTA
ncbi:hypothetical protein [Lichenifustis flavocetrariae]|uniref:Methyltransferase n=1 Tax=Lichenifustis flavocetrariae TaxID=2949735 RepID=A0AA41YVR6_9HYPH|nr:hypothetical protein [Lichenifustis flavocetrariae]MCW6508205.1 hypothetical protein [Lichenifustis flavocetrariae]